LMTVKIPIGSIRGELVQFRQGTVNWAGKRGIQFSFYTNILVYILENKLYWTRNYSISK
jgi:hypothetical protein